MSTEMNLLQKFREFYQSKCLLIDRELYLEIENQLNNTDFSKFNEVNYFEEFIIDENNEDVRLFFLEFYNFLKSEGIIINTKLDNYRLFKSDVTARRVDILKQIQNKVSRKKLAERYNVTYKTIENDINALSNGTRILEQNIVLGDFIIKTYENQETYYKCTETAHPIFLLLNLTQLNSVMNMVEQKFKNSDSIDYDHSFLKNVIDAIKLQCSDYSFEKLNVTLNGERISSFVTEWEMIENNSNEAEKLMKCTQKCKILYKGKEYDGYFGLDGPVIKIGKEEKLVPLNEIAYKKI